MRTSSKLLVVDPDGRVLLLDCQDPGSLQTRWQELPGGGVEPGEDQAQAAVREVLEEAGVVVPLETVGPLLWTQVASFSWRGSRHVAAHEGRVARLPGPPQTRPVELTGPEKGTILGARWWSLQEVTAHQGRFFPRSLPELLPQLLAGHRVDEADDDWDVPGSGPAGSGAVQVLPVNRRAARVLLVDAADRVLLLQGRDPADPTQGSWWFTPGGGLDDGEEPVQAARRELSEETGLQLAAEALGPVVFERVAHFRFAGRHYRQAEVYYLARIERHDVDTSGWTPLEVASVTGHRWWPRAELRTTTERLYPSELADVLDRVLSA